MKPPLKKFGGPRPSPAASAVNAALLANRRKQENEAKVRNALLAILALGGCWFGIQKMRTPQVVGKATAAQTKKHVVRPDGRVEEVEDGGTTSAVAYNDLFKKGQESSGFATTENLGGTTRSDGTSATGPSGSGSSNETAGNNTPARPKIDDIFGDDKLPLVGTDAGRQMYVDKDRELLTKAWDTGAWPSYRDMLTRSLQVAIPKLHQGENRSRYDDFWKAPVFYQAMLRWEILGKFKTNDIYELVHDDNARAMFTWVMNSPKVMEEILLTIKPEDDSAKVMVFLKDAWTAKPDAAQKYFNLALACAVVFDKPMATTNPGGQTTNEGETTVDPLRRYLWYIEKDEKGKLAGPIDRMNARDLVYVVCAPVITSELEWALVKVHLTRKSWGNAYEMVKYLMEKAVKGTNPYTEYTFAEILKKGGICGDRSYFCANTARANGIPAMIFSGETDLGGHAWVGLKVADHEWTTKVGRIGGVSKGQTDNPQTGGSTTEQEVWLWADREHQNDTDTLAVFRLLWLTDFYKANEQRSLANETIRLANFVGKSFIEPWTMLYGVLEDDTTAAGDPAKPEVVDFWKKYAADMRREFRENPRMAALATKAETEHIFPYEAAIAAKGAFIRERRRDSRDAGEQKDLIAETLKREADLILKRNDPTAKKDIEHLYDPALREYGGSITGFKMIMADYFNYMKDDADQAKKAVRDIELAFNRVVRTNSGDFFRTKTEAGIVATIANYYRQVGDDDRAVMLEKRYEREVARASLAALRGTHSSSTKDKKDTTN